MEILKERIRFSLKIARKDDEKEIFSCVSDPFVYENVRIIPDSNQESFVKNYIALAESDGNYIVRDVNGAFIGCAGLHPEKNENNAEIGYFLSPKFYGQGFATEIVKELIFEARERGIAKLYAGAATENIASIRVLQKNNFHFLCATIHQTASAKKRVSVRFEKFL